LRVLHVDTGREMRGGQWQVLSLVGGLLDAGYECLLLAPDSSPLLDEAVHRGIPGRALSFREVRRESTRRQIVHVHTARAHTLAAMAGSRPMVVSRRVGFSIRTNVFSRWKYHRASRYIAVSRYVRRSLIQGGVNPDRISVVYDGTPMLEESKRCVGIIAPATADPRKGSALAREAARRGGFSVHFSSRLQQDLTEASLFVYLTEDEGLGSAALLAMSAGVPVVASRIGGLVEIVEDGVTGLLVENRPDEVAAAVARLVADPEQAAAMGRRGRELVRERFTVEKMVAGTADVYREVL